MDVGVPESEKARQQQHGRPMQGRPRRGCDSEPPCRVEDAGLSLCLEECKTAIQSLFFINVRNTTSAFQEFSYREAELVIMEHLVCSGY